MSKLQIKSEKSTAKNTLWTGCGPVDRDEKPQCCGSHLGRQNIIFNLLGTNNFVKIYLWSDYKGFLTFTFYPTYLGSLKYPRAKLRRFLLINATTLFIRERVSRSSPAVLGPSRCCGVICANRTVVLIGTD